MRLKKLFADCEGLIISDYNYGILTPRLIRCLRHLQRRDRKVLVVDSKRLADYRATRVTAVKPNFAEALALLNIDSPINRGHRAQIIAAHGERLLQQTGARVAAVTMDVDGAWFFEREQPPYRTYSRPYPQSQAAGAGDTFLGALALSLACGADTQTAAEIASAAAAVVVAKEGTALCAHDELEDRLCTPEKIVSSRARIAARSSLYRHHGKRVVLTCGCFDILHPGHVAYLNQAKALGDVLIVAVNSDQSVRRLKGPSRPINRVEDRVQVLAALSSIDHLVVFDETTPTQLIESIRPDVFVKGGDYTRESLPEAETVERLGGEVRIVPFVSNRSTTHLIQRIRKLESAHTLRQRHTFPEETDEERQMDGGAAHFVC
jgi:D-beta-D-heptose 7-phosphate kinase/D-beta-D-heptose 1-phosphate adenosyltransferase